MWNGKCKPAAMDQVVTKTELSTEIMPNVNMGTTRLTQADTNSLRSVSSEDISTINSTATCCNSDATNPAIKRGRQFQLSQVSKKNNIFCVLNPNEMKKVFESSCIDAATACLSTTISA